ncbi:2-hydroxyacid dehydrogenase homolog [Schistocerca gregaria]|uniref:2-hydroxyacid dehydrogenase homolog n=1 Tax=Schistocerca gregaria TaxID=7010 RepID=UPI00211F4149|nr:2-hydroxyacid dehydrogenase homolog [Schistocerca gregaria]
MAFQHDTDIVTYLKNFSLFSTIGAEYSKLVLDNVEVKTAEKGTVLQEIGQVQDQMIIVQEGKIEKTTRDGGYKYVLEFGDISGSLHFFFKDLAASRLVVLEDAKYMMLKTEKFTELCQEHPGLSMSFMRFLAITARERSNLLHHIAFRRKQNKNRIAFFDTKQYMKDAFELFKRENNLEYEIIWIKERLDMTTVPLAAGCLIVCVFVNDLVDKSVLGELKKNGTGLVALRCAGFDNVDLKAADEYDISVTRVPSYSPYAVAEFAASLLMACNRKIHKSYKRNQDYDFELDGLTGFDMYNKTVGVVGTGKIGLCMISIMRGFGCKVVCYDVYHNPELEKFPEVQYIDTVEELCSQCDVISLHVPLLDSTRYMINQNLLSKCKDGVVIINTSRGELIDSKALMDSLDSGKVGAAGLDVYEHEKGIFFENWSAKGINDPILTNLIGRHNVVVTSHQAFLTKEALYQISRSVYNSCDEFVGGKMKEQLTDYVKA